MWRKILQISCVYSKGGSLVIVWNLLVATVFLTSAQPFISNYIVSSRIDGSTFFYISAFLAFFFLFFPLFALVGERWKRYKVLLAGSAMLVVGSFGMLVPLLIMYLLNNFTSLLLIFAFVSMNLISLLGFLLFLANIFQYGADQLLTAPSSYLQSFVHWFAFTWYTTGVTIFLVQSFLLAFVKSNIIVYLFSALFAFLSFLTTFPLLALCLFRKNLTFEPVSNKNPIKIIWGVMSYAWRNKAPRYRSAFTYGEVLPSRLDFAKGRFGGPFTTEQVEDVKSFWNILLILVSTYGYSIQDSSIIISRQYPRSGYDLGSYEIFFDNVVNLHGSILPYATISACVLIFQFIATPFFSRFTPNMLKLLFLGVLCAFFKNILLIPYIVITRRDVQGAINDNISLGNGLCFDEGNYTVINGTRGHFTVPFEMIIVLQILGGLSLFLVFVTGIKFILAQGPRSMQSVLMGSWLFLTNFLAFFNLSYLPPIGCHWEYYTVKTFLIIISLVVFIIAAKRYRYRQRNESSDVNQTLIITQYTERQLNARERFEEMEDYDGLSTAYVIQSISEISFKEELDS